MNDWISVLDRHPPENIVVKVKTERHTRKAIFRPRDDDAPEWTTIGFDWVFQDHRKNGDMELITHWQFLKGNVACYAEEFPHIVYDNSQRAKS